jgi:hypothetical protein
VFGLSTFDLHVILISSAPWLDVRYENIFGYLQDNITMKKPSINLVLDLLCEHSPERVKYYSRFQNDAPLIKHHLIHLSAENNTAISPLLQRTVTLDETIFAWLIGFYQASPTIKNFTRLHQIPKEIHRVLIQDDLVSQLDNAIAEKSLLIFIGPDEVMKDAAAYYLSSVEKRPLLEVNFSAMLSDGTDILMTLQRALRDAQIIDAIAYLKGWESCIGDYQVDTDLLRELIVHPGIVILSGSTYWHPRGISRDRIFSQIFFSIPGYKERLGYWKHFTHHVDPTGNLNLEHVAGQFRLTTSQIRDAVGSARDIAVKGGRGVTTADLYWGAREHSNPNLSGLARKLEARYEWSDIVLPDDQMKLLQEIIATVRCRPIVLDDWGVGRKLASSRGVTALFTGPPGTGKTMAAEIISSELKLDLYKIDLSTVVSKYIGETEKNLERIFNEAETSNAILFFDEADALFGKRSEVRDSHDRYANVEISYLLQRMEAYNGVTILATNLRANLDEAFTRRLQFLVDFPFPEKPDRLKIWQTLFPKEIPKKSNLDFDFLAEKLKIAGGNIRNIIINAAYLAADDGKYITMEHLLHGARRELQKMGRLIEEDYLKIE